MWTKPYFKVKILRLKYTKFDFGCGSAPNPARRAYSAPPDPLGPTSRGREGEGKGGKERGRKKREEGEGKGRGMHPSTEGDRRPGLYSNTTRVQIFSTYTRG